MQEALTSCQVTAANYRAVALENQHNSKEIKVKETASQKCILS